MNWTGGNLARHSRNRPRNRLLARQKRHFAKARSSLYNNNTIQTPCTLSLLGFEIRTRPQHQEIASRHHSSPSQQHDSTPEIAHGHERSPSVSWNMQQDQAPSLHQVTAREPEGARSRSPCSQVGSSHSASTTSCKKRKLLQKPDWVGLHAEQPDELVFSRPADTIHGMPWTKRVEYKETNIPRYHHRSVDKSIIDMTHYQVAEVPEQNSLRVQEPPVSFGSEQSRTRAGDSTTSQTRRKRRSLPHHNLLTSFPRISEAISNRLLQMHSLPRINVDSTAHHDLPRATSSNNQPSSNFPSQEVEFRYTESEKEREIPRVVYAASDIHHPTPCRTSKSAFLAWSPRDPEDLPSTNVQVGKASIPRGSSEANTRNSWSDWFVSAGQLAGSGTSYRFPREATSMGLGPSAPDSYTSSRYQCGLSETGLQHDVIFDVSDRELSPKFLRNILISSSENDLWSTGPLQEPRLIPTRPEPDKMGLRLAGEPTWPKVSKSQVNENSAWVDFILDNGSGDLEGAIRDAKSQVVCDLYLKDTPDHQATKAQNSVPEVKKGSQMPWEILSPSVINHRHSGGSSLCNLSASHVATQHDTDLDEQFEDNRPEPAMSEHTISRFVPPKPFTGRPRKPTMISKPDRNRVVHGKSPERHPGRRGRGKSSKKRGKRLVDARADIREIPDFSGDPIEDFDD